MTGIPIPGYWHIARSTVSQERRPSAAVSICFWSKKNRVLAANHIHDGINAIGIMTMGLAQVRDPYADGFNAVWNYLIDAEQKLQKRIEQCAAIQSSYIP